MQDHLKNNPLSTTETKNKDDTLVETVEKLKSEKIELKVN